MKSYSDPITAIIIFNEFPGIQTWQVISDFLYQCLTDLHYNEAMNTGNKHLQLTVVLKVLSSSTASLLVKLWYNDDNNYNYLCFISS